ncbi:MAG: secretion protein HlyD [Acidobacteria bacterium]|nr:MAG: secretion protein HlyD [Acidobacteriota bacterium]
MTTRYALLITVVAAALVLWLTLMRSRVAVETVSAKNSSARTSWVGGPGLIEPYSEGIQLGSELGGKLKSVNVEEGDTIRRGQVLAELENDDYKAQVASAEAEVLAKDAALRKVMNGARSQERLEALASVRESLAVMNNVGAEMERREELLGAGIVSREEAERYRREYAVATERYQGALEKYSLIDSLAREEDRELAEADLKLARARLAEARSQYAKTLLMSPIDGRVLRKHHRNGESVSNSSLVADPVVTVGDTHTLRVRVEIDETDVSRIRVGQRAYVTADAFDDQRFWGRVMRVGEQLGRKNIRTDQPAERVDTKVLEAIVELDPGQQLPVGLRVDSYIVTDSLEAAQATP